MRSPHPHFDDGGTLDWTTGWQAAVRRARSERRLLFVEMGREACGQCRTLVERIVPLPEVAPLLQRHFVALAADCDDAEDEVLELADHLEDAMMLPFVLIATADGRFLEGRSGAVDPRDLRTLLARHIETNPTAPG